LIICHRLVIVFCHRGLTITEISRTLRLERKTVRRYATAATQEQLITGARLHCRAGRMRN
jgi:DNA-binding transcriptional regulator LsrR (DeoR family)